MRKPASQLKIKTGIDLELPKVSQRCRHHHLSNRRPETSNRSPLTNPRCETTVILTARASPPRSQDVEGAARKAVALHQAHDARGCRRNNLKVADGAKTSKNWSRGGGLRQCTGNPFTVSGRWKVPKIKSFASGDDLNVVIWIGLDGDGSNDVLQAGVHAVMSAGDEAPDLYAWFEWFPDDENSIGLPVVSGDTMGCVITADQDCLPGFTVQQGKWSSIDGGHRLIPMHDGKVLDWKPDDGTWLLWNYDPTSKDCLPGGPVSQGRWESIRDGHCLVPMHDGKVLDWVPDDGTWRLWNYDPANKTDCLPGTPVSHGQWESVRDGHVLVPMKDGKVLDWVPDNGTWRLWNYDPTNTKDCLPANAVSTGKWISLDDDHTLVPMHDGRVIDWVTDGSWRLWNYDPRTSRIAFRPMQWRWANGSASTTTTRWWQCMMDACSTGKPTALGACGITTRRVTAPWPARSCCLTKRKVCIRPSTCRRPTTRICEATARSGSSSGRQKTTISPRSSTTVPSVTQAHAEKTGGELMEAADGDTFDMVENGKTVSKATASGETVTCTFV